MVLMALILLFNHIRFVTSYVLMHCSLNRNTNFLTPQQFVFPRKMLSRQMQWCVSFCSSTNTDRALGIWKWMSLLLKLEIQWFFHRFWPFSGFRFQNRVHLKYLLSVINIDILICASIEIMFHGSNSIWW